MQERRKQVNVLLDEELERALSEASRRTGLSVSALVRDALRRDLALAGPEERGWREGYTAAISEVKAGLAQWLARTVRGELRGREGLRAHLDNRSRDGSHNDH